MPPPPPRTPPARLACPAGGCSKTYSNLSNLAKHITEAHPGLSDKQLANEALCRCPADGCRVFTLVQVGTTNPRSGLQQHLQQLGSGKDAEHTRVVLAAGGIAALDSAARETAATIADPGTRGASLAAPTAHTSQAALQGAAAAAALPPRDTALNSTTPPASFDWARLNEIDLNDLRRLNLHDQDDPNNNAMARNVYQPLVAGLERAGRTRTAPSAAAAAEGWKYYHACRAWP